MPESSINQVRVLFVCGCAEPGKDGVGDYTRRLAFELLNQHCTAAIAAVNDSFVSDSVMESDKDSYKVSRLTSKSTLKEKRDFLYRTIQNFTPNWISLQYVPYSFQSQGVPFNFATSLAKLRYPAHWHIMFHEVHLGGVLSLKNHLVKYGQIKTIKRLVKSLKPGVMHTSNSAYQEMLEQLKIDSKILGLFGNIPVLSQPEEKLTFNDHLIKAVYFGAPPKEYDFHVFANALKAFLSPGEVTFRLEFLGRESPLRRQFAQYLLDACSSNQLKIEEKGEQSPAELSQLFSIADFAIARVKPTLLGKSGAAITLLEHGLKLWVPMAKSQSEIESNFNYRTEQCFADLSELMNYRNSFSAESRVKDIAKQLLADFDAEADSFAKTKTKK